MHGSIFSSLTGVSGEITVPGLGSVVGNFERWTLQRNNPSDPSDMRWTLRGTLSYVNEAMVKSTMMSKKITLVLNEKQKIHLCSWETMELSGVSLIAEGVVQCP